MGHQKIHSSASSRAGGDFIVISYSGLHEFGERGIFDYLEKGCIRTGGATLLWELFCRVRLFLPRDARIKGKEIDAENAELYFLMCMIGNKASDENELRNSTCLLSDDKNFQTAIQFAPSKQKKQLEDIQTQTQVNYFLLACMKENGISGNVNALVHVEKPLATDEYFQKALKAAPPERKKELQRIQDEQPEYFLQQCMMKNHVYDSESDEVQHTSELFRYIKIRGLSQIKTPLMEDKDFQIAFKCAPREMQVQLQQVQRSQSDVFLKKCMIKNNVSQEEELCRKGKKLAYDKDFQLAKRCAPEERKKELEQIMKQNIRKENKLGYGCLIWIFICFLILILCLLFGGH